jgi:hypothetical protein
LRARTAFEMALQNRPDYPNALDNLGDLYVKMAANTYQKNLSLDANNQVAASKLNVLSPITALTIGSRKVVNATAQAPASEMNVAANSANISKANSKTDKNAVSKNAKTEIKAEAKTEKMVDAPANASTETAAAPTQISAEQLSVLTAVNDWAKAWSQKNANAYLKAYSDTFKPAKMSLAAWKEDRKQKISNKGHINVVLNSPEVILDKEQATVKFVQSYESDKLKDVSKKTLVLAKKNGAWLIEKELAQ